MNRNINIVRLRQLCLFLFVLFLTSFLNSTALSDDSTVFAQSGSDKATLVELYSSQGCSSCPPADRFLNNFKTSDLLWKKIIPVAFHVDYWDYIGWKDKYASPKHTRRQRRHASIGNIRSVYTPAFVVDGSEWYGFFSRKKMPQSQQKAVNLAVWLQKNNKIKISADTINKQKLFINVAVLANGIEDFIGAGENNRKTLKQDFVVIAHKEIRSENAPYWIVEVPKYDEKIGKERALVVWLTDVNHKVIQAVGNVLSQDQEKSIKI